MTDPTSAHKALDRLEAESAARHKPEPAEPVTPARAYARALDAARSKPALSIDSGWLR
jgi:hypothetical protein